MTKKTGKGGACPSFFFNTGRFPSWFTKDLPMVAKLLVCIGFSAAFLLVPHPAGKEKPVVPVYRVVLDPGQTFEITRSFQRIIPPSSPTARLHPSDGLNQ